MKTLEEIKDQVAYENDWIDWVCFKADCDITDIEITTDIVAKRFAVEIAKQSLKSAYESTIKESHKLDIMSHTTLEKLIINETNIPKI